MNTAKSITCGFLLTLLAGICNGSWNASFSSKLGIAIPSTTRITKLQHLFTKLYSLYQKISCCDVLEQNYDLEFEYAWILFQIYACVINVIICIVWLGGFRNVGNVLGRSEVGNIVLVVVFSFLWGIGSVSFGLACRIAGVGLGTNLTMGVIVVVGTFLPLITNGIIKTYTGLVIIIGIIVCCVGLYYSMKSLKIRDVDEALQNDVTKDTVIENSNDVNGDNDKIDENDIESKIKRKLGDDKHYIRESGFVTSRPVPTLSKRIRNSLKSSRNLSFTSSTYTTTQKVLLCIIAGILSSLLQFAFIFGQPIIDIANDIIPDKSGSASIIWLLALIFGIPPSLVYGIYTAKQKQDESTVPFYKAIFKCPMYRHMLILLTTSIPWVAHIHLYGIAVTIFLPSTIATSIAWPVLMMITVVTGMLLSIYLGEWSYASRNAIVILCVGLGFSFCGIVILMLSILVPS